MADRMNADIPVNAEMANHACDPNCDFVTMEDPIESYKIRIGGDTYTVRYYPLFLQATRATWRHPERFSLVT